MAQSLTDVPAAAAAAVAARMTSVGVANAHERSMEHAVFPTESVSAILYIMVSIEYTCRIYTRLFDRILVSIRY